MEEETAFEHDDITPLAIRETDQDAVDDSKVSPSGAVELLEHIN